MWMIDWQTTRFCTFTLRCRTKEPNTGWIFVPGEQPCWGGPEGLAEPGEHESASVMLQQQRQIRSWATSARQGERDSGLVRPHLNYCLQLWSPQFKKDGDRLQKLQRRAKKINKRLENTLMRKDWRSYIISPRRRETSRGTSTWTFPPKRMETLFSQGDT